MPRLRLDLMRVVVEHFAPTAQTRRAIIAPGRYTLQGRSRVVALLFQTRKRFDASPADDFRRARIERTRPARRETASRSRSRPRARMGRSAWRRGGLARGGPHARRARS